MQGFVLPKALPNLSDAVLDALYKPAESEALVGGDWYDVVPLRRNRILITYGDVAGHGLDAAILAGRYRHTMSFCAIAGADPSRILERVNYVATVENDAIATAALAIIDLSTGVMQYALAGHPPVIGYRDKTAEILPASGLPLGAFRGGYFETSRVRLQPDTVAVFYTDGLLEFERTPTNALDALVKAVASLALTPQEPQPAKKIKDAVMRGVPPRDDVAVLVLRYTGAR